MLIHIIYHQSTIPDWTNGIMRFMGAKPDGWSYGDKIALSNLPAPYAATYQGVVSMISGKQAPWAATQIWARMHGDDAVSLTIEARQDGTGAIRTFSALDDPSLLITDPAAVAFFRHFTGDVPNS